MKHASLTHNSLEHLRADFPLLQSGIAYLDNASTTQKPQAVIDTVTDYYTTYCANVHRGIYAISEQASVAYEAARDTAQQFINAAGREEIIFTSGTTQSLNLATRLVAQELHAGDEVILTRMEHHAQIVPWQILAKEKGLVLKWIEPTKEETIDTAEFSNLITSRTKVLAVIQMSNVTGYLLPIQEMTRIAHEHGMLVIVDAAQSVPHIAVDVQQLDADFLAFSGHKLCGPTGVGVLYGKRGLLERMQPVFGGGSMIAEVTLAESSWAELPLKFEPGTPNIAGVIGLGAALQYLQRIGMDAITAATDAVYMYALNQFATLNHVRVYGPALHQDSVRHSIIPFTVQGVHPHDVASLLDQEGVAVRAGHHCAQPLATYWNVPATVRASFSFYNTREDVDRLIAAIKKAQSVFA